MNELSIAGIGLLTTIISSIVSWLLAKKKYDSEVDATLINNMKESLEFYKKLSDDNKERLEEVLKRNEDLETQIRELRTQLMSLMGSICTDLSCQIRNMNLSTVEEKPNEKENRKAKK